MALFYETTGGPETPTWQSQNFKVEWLVGSTAETLYFRSAVAGECEGFKFRYATTKVSDGADLVFRVTGDVRANSGTPWIPVNETFTFKAYNKAQSLGTTVDQFGNDNGLFETASTNAHNGLISAMQASHSFLPPTAATAIAQTKTLILEKIPLATVMNGLTHGSNDSFEDSFGADDVTFGVDVVSGRGQKASLGIPDYNLVVFWSCSTIPAAAPFLSALSYGILPWQNNRAYLGFDGPVALLVFDRAAWLAWQSGGSDEPPPPPVGDLSLVSNKFWNRMADGYVVDDSVSHAYETYITVTIDSNNQPDSIALTVLGDSGATLKFVYFNLTERFGKPREQLTVYWTKLPVP